MRRAIGARIASLRFRLDRSERGFAKLLGVPRTAVSAWESGQGLRQGDLRLIANATDTSFEWLAGGFTPEQLETPRHAAVSRGSESRAGIPAPLDDDRIKPLWISIDEGLPEAITSAWKLRPEGSTPSDEAGGASDARRLRQSAVFLHVPDAALLSGGRASAYRWIKGKPENGRAEFLLSLVLMGRRRFEQMGRDFEGRAGSAIFASNIEGGRFSFGADGRYLGVNVLAQSLHARVPNVEARLMQPIAPDSQALRLLSDYVSSLMKCDEGLDRDMARSVADHVVDLCALLLGARGDERALAETRGLRAAQKAAICAAIDAGAATPGFSAQAVAEQLGVPSRYVHFLLEQGGEGFGRLVAARRLALARARLADPRFGRMTVAEVASSCGFVDLQQFHRQFRARFGDAPSGFRAKF